MDNSTIKLLKMVTKQEIKDLIINGISEDKDIPQLITDFCNSKLSEMQMRHESYIEDLKEDMEYDLMDALERNSD